MAEEEGAVVESPVAEVADASPAAAAPASDPWDDPGVEQFPRDYVERLRKENAGHRTKAKGFEEAFAGFEPDDQAVLLETIKTLAADPQAGLAQWDAIAKSLHEQYPDEQTPTGAELKAEAEGENEDKPLTRKELEAFYAQKAEEEGVAQKTKEVLAEAKELGYTEGTAAYQRLMWMTANMPEFGYDLAKADAAIKAEKQSVIDAYIAEREADAEGGTPTGGGVPSTKAPAKPSWSRARAAAEARVAGIQLT